MTRCIALLRGINVGRARRLAMADLRALLEGLGFSDVRTLLNSGNAVFRAPASRVPTAAPAIEAAIQGGFGLPVPVVIVTAHELGVIVAENPLPQAAEGAARFLVALFPNAAALAQARALQDEPWAPEALAVGNMAAYLWCANGVLESRTLKALGRVTSDAFTTRNWATVLKLRAVADTSRNVA